MMAWTKQTVRKSSLIDLHIACLATLARAKQTHPATDEEYTVGDIEVQEVEDQGEIHHAISSDAEGDEEEGLAWMLLFGAYNDEGEPVSEAGDVLEAGQDYIVKEYTEEHPLRRRGPPRD
uniref:Uncharacterized protein n=1 Tax=Cannabis sativa TaxID=3483 RepID=A0A803Q9J6_CANSA